jgi:PAS domain S-box-containing protein
VEEALQHLTEFQESIITNARVWLSVLDKSGKILIWNTAAEEISGYRSEEVIGYNDIWKKIYPDKEYRKQITDTINRIIRDKNYLENFETTILSKGGTKKVISWNTRGIPDATGNVSDYIAIGMDVTDRIREEELRHESERRMTDIISFLPDATLVIDKNGIVLAWNRAMEEMTGVPAEQMIGKGNYEYALPFYHERRPITVDLVLHDDPAIVAKYPFMQKEGRSRRSELFIPHLNNGSGAYLWFKASPLYDGDGNLTGAIESIRDITERKVAEVAIQKNKETYRELVESISDVIFEIDCDGKITYISPVVQKVLEFEPEEMTGKNFIGFVYPDDRNLLNRRFSDLLKGIEHPTDYRVTTKSGNIRWVRTQTKPIMMEKTFCGARGTLIDITLRKVAEEALRESKALTDAVVENVPLMIFLKEATDLRFVIFNKAGEELLGYDRKALLGKNNLDLFPPEQAAHFMAKDREVLDGEAGMLDIPEESILTAKKGLRLLHTRKVCIRGGDGTTKFLLGISEDITERKELEKETENHTQELLKFSSSLAAANKKLNLLSSITRHDINNQMTVLQGYLAILKKKQPDPALIEYLQKSTIAAQRISSMIRFTKEYESIGVAAPVWQDCRIVVDTAAKETPLGQVIVKVVLPAWGEIFADQLIVKVFYNLMDNAVRYGGKITTVRFSVEEHDGDQIIVCEDDGEGVPAEEKEKIFERGFGKNTGMGLFLAREILDITGITIRETGEPGKGARFEMKVPKGAWRIGRSNENKE